MVLASYISNTTSFKIFVGGALRRVIMIYQDPSRLTFFFFFFFAYRETIKY